MSPFTGQVFRQYDIGGKLHSSSDGQKYETRIATVNARHSPEYFGLRKGIVANNLVINNISPNTQVISPNDHESRYVYDIVANNTTDIRPEVHSTDSHGINAVNFALIHLLTGYEFAPRYSDIHDKVSTSLYGFQHPTKYDEKHPARAKPRGELRPAATGGLPRELRETPLQDRARAGDLERVCPPDQ